MRSLLPAAGQVVHENKGHSNGRCRKTPLIFFFNSPCAQMYQIIGKYLLMNASFYKNWVMKILHDNENWKKTTSRVSAQMDATLDQMLNLSFSLGCGLGVLGLCMHTHKHHTLPNLLPITPRQSVWSIGPFNHRSYKQLISHYTKVLHLTSSHLTILLDPHPYSCLMRKFQI